MDETRSGGRDTLGGPSLQVGSSAYREEERKLVTVVFADLSGSTALAERLDPEDMRKILTTFFNALALEVQRFGGTVDKYAGDAVMAVFGAPIGHEDDPQRALRTALAMQRAVVGLNAELDRERGVRLALKVGVNTGLVAAGALSGGVQAAYTVVGDTVNTAQRLQSAAGPGGILVGALTQRLAARAFAFEPVEPLRVKGKAELLVAFRLIGHRAPAAAPLRSALVGRDDELAALLAAMRAVEREDGRIVLITGEAGIGKSRLLAEARRSSAERSVVALEGRALSVAQGVSYLPFIEIFRRDADIAEDEPSAASWAKLERRVGALFPGDVAAVLPYVATLIGLEVPGALAERVRYLDARAMGLQVFANARRYIAQLARERPLVLILEDWHWADESSAALLEHLLPLVETERLGICVASRPEESGTAVARLREKIASVHGARFLELRLVPLPFEDSERLVYNLLAAAEIPASIRTRILERAEGNPLFVEEVVQALIDLGGIVRDTGSGAWRATERLESITLPDTVQGVIVARIDRLEEEVKQVLKLAAVVGRSFRYRVLSALGEADQRSLDEDLGELQRLEFVRERRREPELEYIFKHALVHDAAYGSMLLQRRKELHALVGEVIEQLFPEQLDEFSSVLAYHFARAERWDKAQEYLFRAGDRSEKSAGDAEALAYYRQAVAVYGRAFGARWDPLKRAAVEVKIGNAHLGRGEFLIARESFERSLSLLGFWMPTSGWGIRRAFLREAVIQVWHRKTAGSFSRPRRDATPTEWAAASEGIAWIDFFLGESERLVLDALRLLNVAESNEHALGITVGSSFLGLTCDAFGLRSVAGRYHERAIAAAEQIAHPLALGVAYHALAIHEAHALGDGPSAVAHYRTAFDAYRSGGDERRALLSGVGRVATQRFCGELSAVEALALGNELVRAGEDGGAAQMQAWGWTVLGTELADAGDIAKAEQLLRRSSELLRAVPDHAVLVVAQALLGECALKGGRIDEAITTLEDADRIIRGRRMRTYHVTTARNALVQAYLAAAERGEPERWLAKARQASNASLNHAKRYRDALPGAYRWRGSYEWLRGDTAAAVKWWDRSVAVAVELGGRPDLELTRQERARHESMPSPARS